MVEVARLDFIYISTLLSCMLPYSGERDELQWMILVIIMKILRLKVEKAFDLL